MVVSRLLAALIAASLLLAAAACGGGDGDGEDGAGGTASPAASPTYVDPLSPRVGGLEAARAYLRETGIEGRKGELTDPPQCDLSDGEDGEFCIHEPLSVFAPGLVLLAVALADDPEGEIWQMRIERQGDAWTVTGGAPFPAR